ncbi:MAG: hypothetical protein HOP17_01695 [Acidobacteria bacterium]|nr:hypothetical protein [Acidobacteriota bacterium]
MVDDVRAFCPGCGNSFLKEAQRSKPTIFDRSSETEQFDASMLNMILSDMGLDISKAPNKSEERVVNVPQMPIEPGKPEHAKVIERVNVAVRSREDSHDKPKLLAKSNLKWLVWGSVILVFLFVFLLVIAAAVLVFMFRSRLM